MVIDMKAKADKRTARIQAKKEAIKGQLADAGSDEVAPESVVAPEQIAAGKTKTVAAPEMQAEKTASPRKHQGS